MKSSAPEFTSEPEKVISPFGQSEVSISKQSRNRGRSFWIVSCGILLLLSGLLAGTFVARYLSNPYRTLESFPVIKYFDNYSALAGSKFKAEFRVEADLGWKDGAGRLMLFSTQEDPRPMAVLIPPSVCNGIYFTKGQTYTSAIEVKEGGLIYADSCQKN
jgi:hypothetical protein